MFGCAHASQNISSYYACGICPETSFCSHICLFKMSYLHDDNRLCLALPYKERLQGMCNLITAKNYAISNLSTSVIVGDIVLRLWKDDVTHCISCEGITNDYEDARVYKQFVQSVYQRQHSSLVQHRKGVDIRYLICTACIMMDGEPCLTTFLTKRRCNYKKRVFMAVLALIGIKSGLPQDVLLYIWSLLGLLDAYCLEEHKTGHYSKYVQEEEAKNGERCTIS